MRRTKEIRGDLPEIVMAVVLLIENRKAIYGLKENTSLRDSSFFPSPFTSVPLPIWPQD